VVQGIGAAKSVPHVHGCCVGAYEITVKACVFPANISKADHGHVVPPRYGTISEPTRGVQVGTWSWQRRWLAEEAAGSGVGVPAQITLAFGLMRAELCSFATGVSGGE
jgi:hypothetical protein